MAPLAALLLAAAAAHAAASAPEHWVRAFGFPPTSAFTPTVATASPAARLPANFSNATVRQIVRISTQARRLRLRISNELTDQPLRLGAVHVALAGEDGSTLPDSDHALTFSGKPGITIPADAAVLSDPVDWNLPALSRLAVSSYVPDDVPPPAHRVSEYITTAGDFTSAAQLPGAELVRSGALVTAVEVVSPLATHAVVTLGDSITEGVGSTVNTFRGWPDRLAERLNASPSTRRWSVVNAGIGSNRLLHNNPGRSALSRFDRDVLAVPGVAMVMLLEGINDIGYSHTNPAEAVSADDIIGAYQQLIARAHAHQLAIVAATIPPFEDSHYYDLQGEQTRQAVNQWLRTSHAFDAIVEFDAALRDPAHPERVLPTLHRGDHLHPNDAGYAAMADAIDLKLFVRRAGKASGR